MVLEELLTEYMRTKEWKQAELTTGTEKDSWLQDNLNKMPNIKDIIGTTTSYEALREKAWAELKKLQGKDFLKNFLLVYEWACKNLSDDE